VKVFIKKYCTVKTLTIVILLLSFNLVSFGQDLQNCFCKNQKVESKHSCCKKEDKGSSSEKKENNGCKSRNFDKNVQKDEGTINESKFSTRESKVVVQESINTAFNKTTNQKTYQSVNSRGVRSKVFLDLSSLRI